MSSSENTAPVASSTCVGSCATTKAGSGISISSFIVSGACSLYSNVVSAIISASASEETSGATSCVTTGSISGTKTISCSSVVAVES